jgi:glutathione S-transferase
VLTALERACAQLESDYWFGARMGHADIAVACALRFVSEAHPGLFDPARAPRLSALAERCETTAPFGEIVQPLVPPK